MGPTGAPGLPGPTGSLGATTSKTATTGVIIRPGPGTVVDLALSCDPGQMVISGGVVNNVTNPADITKVHMLDSGPIDGVGWQMHSTVISRFSVDSDLEVVLTILCAQE